MVDNSFSTVLYGKNHRILQIVVNKGNPGSDEIKNKFKKTSPNRDFPYKDSSFTRNDDANMFTQAAKHKP